MKQSSGNRLLRSSVPLLLALTFAVPAQAGIAVKNFREIYDSLVVSTGVTPAAYPAIDQFYAQSYTRLPLTGSVNEVTSPGLLAFTGLAGIFCSAMVSNDSQLAAAQRRATQNVDFTKGPKALTVSIQQSVIENYFGLFLSRSPSQTELQTLEDEFTEVNKNLTTQPADTATSLSVVCTSVASSLESLLL
jgi:hypothetical protein